MQVYQLNEQKNLTDQENPVNINNSDKKNADDKLLTGITNGRYDKIPALHNDVVKQKMLSKVDKDITGTGNLEAEGTFKPETFTHEDINQHRDPDKINKNVPEKIKESTSGDKIAENQSIVNQEITPAEKPVDREESTKMDAIVGNSSESEQDVIIYDTIRIHVFDTIFTYDTVNYLPAEKKRNSTWSVEAFIAPSITSSVIKAGSDEFDIDVKRLENAISSNSGFSAGIGAGYKYKNWVFQTGLAYSRINEDFNDTLITSTTDSVSYYEYTYGGYHDIDTAYWTFMWNPIDSVYILVPFLHDSFIVSVDSTEKWNTITNTTKKFYNNLNSYTYLEIPFSIGYEFSYQRFSIIPSAGGVVGILLNAKGRTISFYDNNALTEMDKNKLPFLKTTFSWMVGLGIHYRFNNRFIFVTEPYFKQNLNSIYENRHPVSQKFSTAGIRVGIKYEF
jgi:opacity protein-like surface antigen